MDQIIERDVFVMQVPGGRMSYTDGSSGPIITHRGESQSPAFISTELNTIQTHGPWSHFRHQSDPNYCALEFYHAHDLLEAVCK